MGGRRRCRHPRADLAQRPPRRRLGGRGRRRPRRARDEAPREGHRQGAAGTGHRPGRVGGVALGRSAHRPPHGRVPRARHQGVAPAAATHRRGPAGRRRRDRDAGVGGAGRCRATDAAPDPAGHRPDLGRRAGDRRDRRAGARAGPERRVGRPAAGAPAPSWHPRRDVVGRGRSGLAGRRRVAQRGVLADGPPRRRSSSSTCTTRPTERSARRTSTPRWSWPSGRPGTAPRACSPRRPRRRCR